MALPPGVGRRVRADSTAWPGSTTASISPSCKASAAEIGAGSISICRVRAAPMRAGNDTKVPMSPARPILVKVVANVASRAATTRSQAAASAVPAPYADPSTAASTGLGVAQMARMTRCAKCTRSSAFSAGMRCIVEMSPPEQNTGPAPVTMITRMAASESADSIASASAMRNSMSIALRFSGRLRVTRAHRRDVVDEYWAGGRCGHWSPNFGGRRSITARSPSSASWVPDNSDTVRDSSASRCSTEAPTPFHTRRLVADRASVGELANVAAISVARVDNSSSGTVSVIRPISLASAADKRGIE